ncbi:MAG: response regulator [Armatimonadota bacterium]
MSKKILMIDDEEDLIFLVSFRLKSKGFEVVTASGGAEGIEKAKAENPDLILLDVMMPEMDGYQTAKKLRSENITAPIVFLTGTVDPLKKPECIEEFGNNYVLKPFEPDELIEKINKELP